MGKTFGTIWMLALRRIRSFINGSMVLSGICSPLKLNDAACPWFFRKRRISLEPVRRVDIARKAVLRGGNWQCQKCRDQAYRDAVGARNIRDKDRGESDIPTLLQKWHPPRAYGFIRI